MQRKLIAEQLECRQLLASVMMEPVSATLMRPSAAAVHVENAADLRAAEVHFKYDPLLIQIQQDDIRPGAAWSNGASVISKVDESVGEVTVFVFSSTAADVRDGNLLEIALKRTSIGRCHSSATIDLQEVRLNEGEIVLTNEPVVGPDSTDGMMILSQPRNAQQQRRQGDSFVGPMQRDHVDTVMADFHSTFRQQMISRRN